MIRKLFLYFSLCSLCLWGLQLLIFTQPQTVSRVVIADEACALPCFLGIRPTITTGDEAYDLLRHHGWISNLRLQSTSQTDVGQINWGWSGQQPDWIDARRMGRLWFSGQYVARIAVHTTIPLGDVWLQMGQPELRGISWRSNTGMDYNAGYDEENLIMTLKTNCPLRIGRFWYTPVQITFGGDTSQFIPFDLSDWLQDPLCR